MNVSGGLSGRLRYAVAGHNIPACRKLDVDAVRVREVSGALLVAVADGSGGTAGGGLAAQTAVMKLVADPAIQESFAIIQRFEEVDRALHTDLLIGETTAVFVAVSDQRLVGASVGDSGAWLISESGWDDLSEHQIRRPFLGTGEAMPVAFERREWTGDTLLVATDGLLKYAPLEAICRTARLTDLEEAASRLVALVRLPSGEYQDDVAVVLCRHA